MRVLVTGGTSLLGGNIARLLAERGDEVTLLQRSSSGFGLPEVRADLSDAAAVRSAVEGHDAVVHLAAKVGVVGAESDFVRVNVEGTRTLLEACTAAGVGRLVHVSSPSVAHAGRPLVGEGAGPAEPHAARGHYARTKAAAELLALAPRPSGPAVVAIRPHLVWGPGDTQLVGRIIARARSGRLALPGGGTALIDTTYIDNAADALVHALDRAPELAGRALVVTNGEPRTVAEMVERILRAARVQARLVAVPAAVGRAAGSAIERGWARARPEDEPPLTRFVAEQLSTAHWFDQRETRRLLQWEPRVSLADGFERLGRSFDR